MSLGLGIGMLSRRGPYRVGSVSHPILDALVSYWELDEASDGSSSVPRLDSHSGGYDLTDVNTVTSVTESWGEVASFDNSNDEQLQASDGSLLEFTADMEVWGWYYPSLLAALVAGSKDNGSTGRLWGIQYIGGTTQYRAYIQDTLNNFVFAYQAGNSYINAWTFLSVQFDFTNSRLGLSVNGGAYAYTSFVGTPQTNAAVKLAIGGYYGYTAYDWKGRIAGVGAVTGLLSSASLAWLYSAGRPRTYAEIQAYTG